MSVCAVVAADPVHEEMSWLNAEANLNIYPYSHLRCVPTPNVLVERRSGPSNMITMHRKSLSSVFQLPMSWLNAEADKTYYHSVTCAVFQLPMSWLNAEAIET